MTKKRTLARSVAGLALAWAGACGGDGGAGQDASALQDGGPPGDMTASDAAIVDCSGDHRESAESNNNPFPPASGSAERTGLSVAAGGPGFTLCGEIDPGQANGQFADLDSFEFTIAGNRPVNLRIEMVASAPTGALILDLFRVDEGPPMQLARGPFRGNYALVAGKVLPPGTYWVSATAQLPAPEQPIAYSISVRENELSCPSSVEMDYVEMDDMLGDSRANDVVAVDEGHPATLTENMMDVPEMTGIVLAPGEMHRIQGTSDAVLSAGDSYRDRDTYLVGAGPDTTELELRLRWQDDANVDLDVYLFGADEPDNDYSVNLGRMSGTVDDEVMTLNVDPSRSYWLWVGGLDADTGDAVLPLPYDITLCPRQHAVPPVPP